MVAIASAVGIGIIVTRWVTGGRAAPAPHGLRETAAVAPFSGYREVRVEIDDRCARVVVADTEARREKGLRGARDLGPYSGMLFAQHGDSNVAFTMSRVGDPLDITWFAADGSRIGGDAHAAVPAATPTRARCTASPRPYRFAARDPRRHRCPAVDVPVTVSPCV